MATTKKKPTSKPAAKRKTTKKAPAAPVMRSFVLTKDTPPFVSFRVTTQTIYWAILGGLILILGIWVVILNVKVHDIYNQLQSHDAVDASSMMKKH